MFLLMHHVAGGMALFLEAFAHSFGRMSNICPSFKTRHTILFDHIVLALNLSLSITEEIFLRPEID